jgi:peroxiredoxin
MWLGDNWKSKEGTMALKVGQYAPDFTLENHLGEKIRLSDYLGKKNVVIAFFPLAWTPI